jgi:hypothetical protein
VYDNMQRARGSNCKEIWFDLMMFNCVGLLNETQKTLCKCILIVCVGSWPFIWNETQKTICKCILKSAKILFKEKKG